MAVYTKINQQTLNAFLTNYELGELLNVEEIREGVENSNYKLIMTYRISTITAIGNINVIKTIYTRIFINIITPVEHKPNL